MELKKPTNAVIILDKQIILSQILRYLYKFNYKKLIILNFTNFKNYKIFKNFDFKIIEYKFNNKTFEFEILQKEKILRNLDKNFLILKSSKFSNINLYDLFEIFKKNKKKLTITYKKKNKSIINIEYYFLSKKFLKLYDFSFFNLKNKKKYIFNFSNKEILDVAKENLNSLKIKDFFLRLYSKLIILDRDGVINVDKGYVGFKKDFSFQNGAIKTIKLLNKNGYNIFVVSNQSGIARGYFTNKDVKNLHIYLRDVLSNHDCYINKIYYSPYHKDGIIKKYSKKTNCRKPGIKLFKTIEKEWEIKISKDTYMIGDQITDIQFAKNAEIQSALFKKGNLFSFVKNLNLK